MVCVSEWRQNKDRYAYVLTGRRKEWKLGAGEILLTSMNHDGTKTGFAFDITKKLSQHLPVPVIASGGGGTMQHFVDVFEMQMQMQPWPQAYFILRKSIHSRFKTISGTQ